MSTTTIKRSDTTIKSYVEQFHRDGFVVLEQHLDRKLLDKWREEFLPLLEEHIAKQGHKLNRGNGRFYVTLPFIQPFADTRIFEDPTILAIVEELVGKAFTMCQLATDTPLLGSEYQETHRDTPPLFPELEQETPPFQLAVNFPLVDVTAENGPIEIARGTHKMSKQEGMDLLQRGEVALEPIYMKQGDVMVRDVRGLHRGTPNKTNEPRPMVVIGYSRRWLFRPEVSIRIPRETFQTLSERAKQMLRHNPIVEKDSLIADEEIYQSFAY